MLQSISHYFYLPAMMYQTVTEQSGIEISQVVIKGIMTQII